MPVTIPGQQDDISVDPIDSPSTDTPPERPSLDTFMQVMKARAPQASDRALHQYWAQHYSDVDPKTLPTWTDFHSKVKAEHPDTPDDGLREYWDEHYGDFGAAEQAPPGSDFFRRAADVPVGLVKGVVDLPKIAVGLADIPTGGAASRGTATVLKVLGEQADQLGLPAWARPSQWSNELQQLYSPETQAAVKGSAEETRKSVEQAKAEGAGPLGEITAGVTGTVKGLIQHPSAIVPLVSENIAQMGVIAKGTALLLKPLSLSLNAEVVAGTKTAAEADALLGKAAVKYASAGEGLMSAGQVSSQISEQDPRADFVHRLAAVVAGVTTAAITRGVAKIPGLGDIEASMAAKSLGRAGGFAGSMPQRLAKGILAEGILQELPQSAQEQLWQNLATGKPWQEGLGEQAVQGLVAGGVLGGAGAAYAGPSVVSKPLPTPPPEPPPDTTIHPETVPAAVGVGDPTVSVDDAITIAGKILREPRSAIEPTTLEPGLTEPNETPILPGAELSGPVEPVTPTQAWQAEGVAPVQPTITPGQAFTPRGTPTPGPRDTIEAERQRLLNQPRVTPSNEGIATTEAVSSNAPLQTAAEKAYPPDEQNRLRTQEELLLRQNRAEKRPAIMPTILGGPEEAAAPIIEHGTAFTPRQLAELTPKERIALERAKLVEMRSNKALIGTQSPEPPTTTGDEPTRKLTTALDRAYPSTQSQNPSEPERIPNASTVDSKSLANLVIREPFKSHGFRGLDIPSQRLVMDQVFAAAQDLKVRQAIVRSLPIDVMDDLRGKQLTPDSLFNDEAVFTSALSPHSGSPISLRADTANALIRVAARAATESLGESRSGSTGERFSALVTGNDDASALKKADAGMATELIGPGGTSLTEKNGATSDTSKVRHDVAPSSDVVLGAEAAETASVPPTVTKPGQESNKKEPVRSDGETFSLTSQSVQKSKPKSTEQLGIPVPAETSGTRPIIGREVQPEEAPLFSKSAQTPEAEQLSLEKSSAGKGGNDSLMRLDEGGTIPQSPTEILANALRQAADQIQGKPKIEETTLSGGEKVNAGVASLEEARKRMPITSGERVSQDTMQSKETDQGTALHEEAAPYQAQTDSPAFKRWFGDSKVVDEDGNPLVVYHGTDAVFDSFSTSELGKTTGANSATRGFFFTDTPDLANYYPQYDMDLLLEYGGFVRRKKPDGKLETGKELEERADRESPFGKLEQAKAAYRETVKQYEASNPNDTEWTYIVKRSVPREELLKKFPEDFIETIAARQDEISNRDPLARAVIQSANALKSANKEAAWFSYLMKWSKQSDAGGDTSGEVWEATKTNKVPNIIPAYLSIQTPFVYDYQGSGYREVSYDSLLQRAISEGHDGAIFLNTKDPVSGNVYVAFKPTQIKSATGNRGTFDPNNPSIVAENEVAPYQPAPYVDPFYSHATKTLEQKMPNRASAEQIKGILSPANGVKPDELKWLGLDDFLKTKETFTKQGVLEFVKANQVQVQEVEKGERIPSMASMDRRDQLERIAANGHIWSRAEREEYDHLVSEDTKEGTKFQSYQLPGGPLSRDTEVLTDAGWSRIDTVQIGQQILTRKDEDGELEWQPIEAKPFVWAEFLYHFKNQSVDMMVTPNHQMVVKRRRRSSGKIVRMTAEQLWKSSECVIPLTGTWKRKSVEHLFGLDAGDVAEFIGWYLAEGSYKHRNGFKNTLQIAQCDIANPGHCARIAALCHRLGFSAKYYGGSFGVGIRGMPEGLKALLHAQPTSAWKHIPPEFFNLGAPIIQRLIDGLILGDGHTTKAARNRTPKSIIFTKSSRLAGDLQALVALTGRRATVRQRKTGLYEVYIAEKQWASVDDAKRAIEPYKDFAFCVTVKNHAIYIRRNGRAAFTGNSNYRELLLTLPFDNKVPTYEAWKDHLEFLGDKPENMTREKYDEEVGFYGKRGTYDKGNVFTSSHFSEPNILAHLRFNDRTDSEGRKVLFIEEAQSDLHQQGRKKGYKDNNLAAKVSAIDARITQIEADAVKHTAGGTKDAPRHVIEEWTDLKHERDRLIREDTGAIPDFPFKKTWHELAMKRALRYAAEHGYDSLAWTTGAQQVDRYPNELRKVVDRIEWKKKGYAQINDVTGYKGKETVFHAQFDANGIITQSSAAEAMGKSVAEVFGKSMAEKILAQPSGEIEGKDFTVGGEGMKGFYDKILPDYLNKYGKKWLTKVGTSTVIAGIATRDQDLHIQLSDDAETWGIFDNNDFNGPPIGEYPNEAEARSALRRIQGEQATAATVVHSFPITPAMKRSVLTEGQALFENSPKYDLREGEQTALNYSLARAALGDLDRAGQNVSATTGAIDRVGGDVRTVALSISPDLIHQGVVDLTGYAVTSPEDLAKLAQVYRDPRFETFRVIYLKDQQIVGHEGLTSRLPGLVMVFKNKADREAKLAAMQTHMDALGANGYYLLHNHPSGRSAPSPEDFELTTRYAVGLPGFKGHVVIDSNEYSVIDFDEFDDLATTTHALNLGPDRLLTPSLPHPLLGAGLSSSEEVARVGKAIQPPADYATVLYHSRTGTRAIQEISVAFLSDPVKAGAYLREQAVAFGAQQIFTHYAMQPGATARMTDLIASVDRLIQDGILRDHVTSASVGNSVMGRQDLGVTAEPGMMMGQQYNEIEAERVAEGGGHTDSPAFKRWFGDSKVVDANGEPLVVYHGTDSNFTKFAKSRTGQMRGSKYGPGAFFFVNNTAVASGYAGNDWEWTAASRPNVMPVYLSLQKPLVVDAEGMGWADVESEAFRKARRNGHDGIIFENVADYPNAESMKEGLLTTYVAFEPTQIKSATGNRGTFDPNNPSIVAAPQAPYRSRAEHIGEETGTIEPSQTRQRLMAAQTSARPYLLGALGLEQIAQVYGRDHAEVADYNKASQQMEADFTESTRESDAILKQWDALKIPVADSMARVMERARFMNYDPDPLADEAPTSTAQKDLRTAFTQLPDAAKTVYREAREFYTKMANDRFRAIEQRIQRAGGTPENTKAILDKLHLAYEQVRAKVYFPFSRFGEHVVIAKQMKDGKEVDREVSTFDSPMEAGQFAALMKARGWTVKQTLSKQYSREQDGSASKAVKKILDIIDQSPIQVDMMGIVSSKEQLKDAINQTFLNSLPDMSYAKHFIHAKDVKGFSKDALRAFAHSALHGAHHISRIQNADILTRALSNLNTRIQKTEEGDVTEARQVYNELVQRHESLLNPNTHPVAAWLGQLGFTMSLGGVVATGLTNATQVPLITLPWLGSRYGFTTSTVALGRAYKDFLDPKTLNADSLFDASRSSRLTQPERDALKELQRRGRIDLTQTMDLSGRASQDNLSRVARQTGTLQGKIAKMLGFTFHAPEVMNRQVTALATYRMERARGGTVARAVDQAEQAIIDTHFIYTCVSTDTECLTVDGWKHYDQIAPGDRVYGVDAAGALTETRVQKVNVHPGEHKVLSVSNKYGLSMVMTENHRCLVQRWESRKKAWSTPYFIEAGQLAPWHHIVRVPVASNVLRAPVYSDDFVTLLAWVLTEGCYHKHRNCKAKRNVRIVQSVSHNPKYVDAIENLLLRLGGHYKRYDQIKPTGDTMAMFSLRMPLSTQVLEAIPSKLITAELVGRLTIEQMRLFLRTFVKGDGHIKTPVHASIAKGVKLGGGSVITQKSIQNMDYLQMMSTLSGISSSLRPRKNQDWHDMTLMNHTKRSVVKKMSVESMVVDTVWCPTTDCGTWIARRNGRVFVTGNSENRPRYMSGNVLRVLTMFKQYSQNVAFLYGRSAQLWLTKNHATPEERAIAKKQLLSMASLQFAAAGALGMPFVGTIASLLTAMMNAFGDDDDKKDWEVELRKMLAEQVGKDAGEVLSHGLSRLTPWDMAARLGQSDLFFRAPSREREGRAGAMDWATSFAGPVLGYAVNAYLGVGDVVKGMKDADAGHFLRGVEELTPSVVKNGVKALRYEIEGGVRTRDQHKQLDVNYAEKMGQFFGFTPRRSAEMYESVNAIKNAEHHLTQRRNDLLDQYAAAYQDHDAAAIRSALSAIQVYNQKHPYLRINGDTILRSLKGRATRERGTTGGVYLPKRREPIRQEGAFGNF